MPTIQYRGGSVQFFPVFLSVVLVVRNQSSQIEQLLTEAATHLKTLVSDYELIIVDNASDDDSVSVLSYLTRESGHPNLQVYALTKVVDTDTASWAGLENALAACRTFRFDCKIA